MYFFQICDDEPGRGSVFGGSGSGASIVDRGSTGRNREAFPHHQELFRRPLKTRGDLDDVLSQGSPFAPPQSHGPSHDKFNSFNTNGYQSGGGGFRNTNRHNQQQQSQFYQQNRYNNNQHNNSSNNTSNSKDLAPRFKRMLNAHQQGSTNVEEISLRPASNSMLFRTHSKPQVTQRQSLLSEPLMPPLKPSPPIQTKDTPMVVIKQASTEKSKSNKKEKVSSL